MTQTRSESDSRYEAYRAESERRHTEIMQLLRQRFQNTKPLPPPPSTAAAPTITTKETGGRFEKILATFDSLRAESKRHHEELMQLLLQRVQTSQPLPPPPTAAMPTATIDIPPTIQSSGLVFDEQGYPLHAFPEGHIATKVMGEEAATTEVGETVADVTVAPTKPNNVVIEKKNGVEERCEDRKDDEKDKKKEVNVQKEESNEDKDGLGEMDHGLGV